MKNASLMIICCIFLVVLFPFFIKSHINNSHLKHKNPTYKLKIFNTIDNSVSEIPLDEYVWRVTAKEMPLSFHDEAIKAQMVAARTYAIRKTSVSTHENGADVCTDHNHCTAFLTLTEEKSLNNKSSYNRLIALSKETSNKILTYNSQPILAVFHAISSGTTEKSSDMWTSQLPYLTNVDSSLDKNVTDYATEKIFAISELQTIFKTRDELNFQIVSYTSGGSVRSMKVGNDVYSGTQIRQLLNLRSNNFKITQQGDTYIFNVKGYGHGVGMSQAGANEYAKSGLNYKDILFKYYPGTKLEDIKFSS